MRARRCIWLGSQCPCNDNLNHEISDNDHKVLTDQTEEIIKVESSIEISK